MNIWERVAHLLAKLLLTPRRKKNTILPQKNYNVLAMQKMLGIRLRNKMKEYKEMYKYRN